MSTVRRSAHIWAVEACSMRHGFSTVGAASALGDPAATPNGPKTKLYALATTTANAGHPLAVTRRAQ